MFKKHQKQNLLNQYFDEADFTEKSELHNPNMSLLGRQKSYRNKITNHTENSSLQISRTIEKPQSKLNVDAYDTFVFIDRLTKQKMVFKDARKTAGSMNKSFSRLNSNKEGGQRNEMKALISIYKKTKKFQMAALKEKLYKDSKNHNRKSSSGGIDEKQINNPNSSKSSKNICFLDSSISQKQLFPKKSSTSHFQQSSQKLNYKYISQRKNQVKSFIQTTIHKINRNQLKIQRLFQDRKKCQQTSSMSPNASKLLKSASIASVHHVNAQILQMNRDKTKIKTFMNKQKIEQIVEYKQRQQASWSLDRQIKFKQKEKFIFKDLSNLQRQSTKQSDYPNQSSHAGQASHLRQGDEFYQRMILHAQNKLKQQYEYLIPPSKTTIFKKVKTHLRGKQGQQRQCMDLTEYSFIKNDQSNLIKQVKEHLARQTVIRTQGHDKTSQLIYLIKNNYVPNISIEIATNPVCHKIKDERGNNLLHMAIKYQRYEVLQMAVKKLPFQVTRTLLLQKNQHKRSPVELAELLCEKKAIEIIEQFYSQNAQKQLLRTYLAQDKHQYM